MSTTDGTVDAVRTQDPPAEMLKELHRLRARVAKEREQWGDSTPATRQTRDAAMVKWHKQLGEGSLSMIAREAGVSRVQAGRITKAAASAEPGKPPPPTRHFYQ